MKLIKEEIDINKIINELMNQSITVPYNFEIIEKEKYSNCLLLYHYLNYILLFETNDDNQKWMLGAQTQFIDDKIKWEDVKNCNLLNMILFSQDIDQVFINQEIIDKYKDWYEYVLSTKNSKHFIKIIANYLIAIHYFINNQSAKIVDTFKLDLEEL